MGGMKGGLAVMCAVLCTGMIGVGCGGSSSTSAPPSNARNEADWAVSKEWAKQQVEPLEASLGVSEARKHEAELAKAHYETLVAREHATPQEKKEAESPEQTPAKEQAEKQVQKEREAEGKEIVKP